MTHKTNSLVLVIAALASGAAALAAQEQGAIFTGSTASYVVNPGDVLRIEVFGRETLTGQFQVDELGNVNYPMLGAISTRGITVAELRDILRSGLENLFASPFVTITPLFRLAVLGEVRNPGLYTIDPTLTVLDVVALAGGPTSVGDLNRTRLIRAKMETTTDSLVAGSLAADTLEQTLRGRTLQEMGVRSGDRIVVPRKKFTLGDIALYASIAQLGVSIIILLRQ